MLAKQFIFILTCFFFIQMIMLSWELGKKAFFTAKKSYIIISLMLAVMIINFDHIYYFLDWFKEIPQLINVWVPVWFFIPPLFFLLIKNYLLGYRLKWFDLLHLLIPIYSIYTIWPSYFWTGQHKLEVYSSMMIQNNGFKFSTLHAILVLQMVAYAILGIGLTYHYTNRSKKVDSNSIQQELQLIYWLMSLYLLFALLIVIAVYILPQSGLFDQLNGMATIALSAATIVLSKWILRHKQKVTSHQQVEILEEASSKYQTSGLSEDDLSDIVEKVISVVTEKELYKNPTLKISDLANESGIKSHHISQALSQKMNKSFYVFINDLRVDAVKQAIEKGEELKNYSLIGLSELYGFNSSSSFYRIFKGKTGKTPGAYMKEKGDL